MPYPPTGYHQNGVSALAFEIAESYLKEKGYGDRIMVFDVSSATVALAAQAIGTEPARIAKSLTFLVDGKAVMIVCAGDGKVKNGLFKAFFHEKAKMLTGEEVSTMIGHEIGGVCPFGIPETVSVYLDSSLQRFDIVYPACGSDNSAVRLTPDELYTLSNARAWVEVCGLPE